jgi:hypothetical protein
MPSDTSTQTTIHPVAHERLKALPAQLASQRLPDTIRQIDIVSALVLYSTPPQIAGMLGEYWDYLKERRRAEAKGEEPPEPATW